MLLIARMLAVRGSHSPHARAALQLQHTHTAKAARRQTVAHEGQRDAMCSVAAAAAGLWTKQLRQLQKLTQKRILIQSLSNSTGPPPSDDCGAVRRSASIRDVAKGCCCMIFGRGLW